MKKIFKSILSSVLIVVICAVPLGKIDLGLVFVNKASAIEYSVGDTIQFGNYPQSKVTDSSTLSALNSLHLNWISYGYYSGRDSIGSMVQSDYMKYTDVEYLGNKYRAVYFTSYRPWWTGGSSGYTYQNSNGYYKNTIYWFKYEPINWIVLDPNVGFIFCKNIIDAQAFSNTAYKKDNNYYNSTNYIDFCNDYGSSSIRKWLNNDFYNIAFDKFEKNSIVNEITLLSYNDITNLNYGFINKENTDILIKTTISDYSFCQGIVPTQSATWWLKTPNSNNSFQAMNYWYGNYCGGDTTSNQTGIRPALYLKNMANIYSTKVLGTFNSYVLSVDLDGVDGSWISPVRIDGKEYDVKKGVIASSAKAECYVGKYVTAYIKDNEIVNIEITEEPKVKTEEWFLPSSESVNYSATTYEKSKAANVVTATNEFIQSMQNYVNAFRKEANGATVNYNDIVKALKNKKIALVSIANAPNDAIDSSYNAIAHFLVDIVNNNNKKIKIDTSKSESYQALQILNQLPKSWYPTNYPPYYYGNYKVCISAYLAGSAFTGSITVTKYKGSDLGTEYIGSIVSDEEQTKKAFEVYVNNLKDIELDECKQAMSSVYSNFMNVTGIAEATNEQLNSFFADKTEKLIEGKCGNVLLAFERIKVGYTAIKRFKEHCAQFNASEFFLSVNDMQNALSMYNDLKSIDFSEKAIKGSLVKKEISLVENARKKLVDELYNYLYNTNTGDPEYHKTVGETIVDFFKNPVKCITGQCPIEFEIYDSDGELLGYVDSSENHDDYIYYTDDIYIDVIDDVKYIYYPSDMEISVKAAAIDDGMMNYSIEDYENGKPTGKINYFDVPLTNGESYTQTIPANADLNELCESISLQSFDYFQNGEYIDATDNAYITVDCMSSGNGYATGNGEYPMGSCVQMLACSNEDTEFVGWFANDVLVSRDILYQFTATEDIEVIAVFSDPSINKIYKEDSSIQMTQSDNNNFAYGFEAGTSFDNFSNLINFAWSYNFENADTYDKIGTGLTVNTRTGTKSYEHTVVIFGDVNSDGIYDGTDAIIVNCIANGMLTKEQVGEAVYMAADCNHDGVIDNLDVELLQQAGVLLASVGQNKTQEELQTSSAYTEYLNLIDQNPVNEDKESYIESESTPSNSNQILDFISDIIAFIKNLINFIKTIFA